MKLIYDLDGMVYTAAFAAQTTIRKIYEKGSEEEVARFTSAKDRDEWMKSAGFQKRKEWLEVFEERQEIQPREGYRALEVFHHIIEDPIYRFQPEVAIGFLSCPTEQNFRYQIYPLYKQSRAGMPKPIHFDLVRNEAASLAEPIVPGLEADDLCVMESYKTEGPWVIVADDKDYFQNPGVYWNWKKYEKIEINRLDATKAFWTQVLTGDRVDDIPGLKGIGPKTAEKLLEEATSWDHARDIVSRVYKEHGVSGGVLSRNASLLYLVKYKGDTWTGDTG